MKKVEPKEHLSETRPKGAVSKLPDDLMGFFQPGNERRIEGLIPDFEVPAPEGEHRELESQVTRALSLLPRGWRTAIVLYHVEGQPMAEIAKVNGITEDEAKRYLQYAREYLRQILLESGLKLRKSAGDDSQTKALRKAAR